MDKQLIYIEIEKIKTDPNQPRKTFDAESIENLATSIKTEGLINAIELDTNFVILTGERRFKAIQLLNWKKVPVVINPTEFDEYSRLRHQMVENIQQSSVGNSHTMGPIDTAHGYARLLNAKIGKDYRTAPALESLYGPIKEIADELGVSMDVIEDHLRILDYPEYVQKDIERGRARTYYREVEFLPEKTKAQMQQKISRGFYNNREEIRSTVQMLRKFPESTELLKEQKKQNEKVSRILNYVARLALALDRTPLDSISTHEQEAVKSQLNWIKKMVDEYLTNS